MKRARTTIAPCWWCRKSDLRLLVRVGVSYMHVHCVNTLRRAIDEVTR